MSTLRSRWKKRVGSLAATLSLMLAALRDLFLQIIPLGSSSGGFAFLVHPRDFSDVFRKYPFLRRLPPRLLQGILRHLWPVVLSEITGLRSREGRGGWG
jgi:hypothetical protein